MFDFINRVRQFDIRKLTPLQWAMIAVGALLGLWILKILLDIAATLIPVVLLVVIAYMGFRVLSSRGENAKAIQDTKREEQLKQATDSTAKAAKQVETVIATKITPVEQEPSRLSVEPVVNPETGFAEPDMARLLEAEENKLKQAKQTDAEEVQRQLEERRKRLLGGQ